MTCPPGSADIPAILIIIVALLLATLGWTLVWLPTHRHPRRITRSASTIAVLVSIALSLMLAFVVLNQQNSWFTTWSSMGGVGDLSLARPSAIRHRPAKTPSRGRPALPPTCRPTRAAILPSGSRAVRSGARRAVLDGVDPRPGQRAYLLGVGLAAAVVSGSSGALLSGADRVPDCPARSMRSPTVCTPTSSSRH